ncbi:MAG: hypothetical protein Q8Q37_01945 [bacterium]|nr:hypothetical protein [bacterium]
MEYALGVIVFMAIGGFIIMVGKSYLPATVKAAAERAERYADNIVGHRRMPVSHIADVKRGDVVTNATKSGGFHVAHVMGFVGSQRKPRTANAVLVLAHNSARVKRAVNRLRPAAVA